MLAVWVSISRLEPCHSGTHTRPCLAEGIGMKTLDPWPRETLSEHKLHEHPWMEPLRRWMCGFWMDLGFRAIGLPLELILSGSPVVLWQEHWVWGQALGSVPTRQAPALLPGMIYQFLCPLGFSHMKGVVIMTLVLST